MMKKTLFGLIAGVMVFAMGCASTYKADNGMVLLYKADNDHVYALGCKGNPLEITIPAQIRGMPVTSIGMGGSWYPEATWGKQLTSVTIPDSVIYIDGPEFADNQLTSVTIPDSVTYIGWGAFERNQLTSVILGNGVTKIEQGAFQGNQLTSVTIPNSVTTIKSGAFADNPLTSVTIGLGVDLADDAFPENLAAFYKQGGRRAGTYRYIESSGAWN